MFLGGFGVRQIFDEKFSPATARVSAAGQIHFCHCRCRIEQGAHTFYQLEANVANGVIAKPAAHGSALQSDRKLARLV